MDYDGDIFSFIVGSFGAITEAAIGALDTFGIVGTHDFVVV